jgi:ribosome-associated heat shock protein Hsp15
MRTVTVKSLMEKRVSAPEARECYEETTPQEVFESQKRWHQDRSEGMRGRPTKRDRREMNRIRGFFE